MPLREDLLEPIPGENPSGKSMRYDRVYDQIKEARSEEDDTLPAGAWGRTAKRADYKLVLKLAGDVLATKSKDLQITAWLGEAHIKQEGAALVTPVLTLFLNLQKNFWETIYPEIDEGDVGLRAMPLQWAGNRYAALVYGLALTKSGVDFHAYKAARAMGSEAEAAGNDARTKARAEAIARGQATPEEVDAAIAASSKAFYAGLEESLQSARDVLEDLAIYCEEQYGEDGPSFSKLRDSLEQVHNVVTVQLSEKRRLQPDAPPVGDAAPEAEAAPEPVTASAPVAVAAPAPVAAAPPPAIASSPAVSVGGRPQSWDDAVRVVQTCASYMASERQGSAVPYLLQTAIRWGELRREAPMPPQSVKVAPSSQQRQTLELAFAQERWSDLLDAAMIAAAEPCGRAWLDLHRYIWAATKGEGYEAFNGMVAKSVKGLLADFPDLLSWTLNDETPAASPETQQWANEEMGEAGSSMPSMDFSGDEQEFNPDPSPEDLYGSSSLADAPLPTPTAVPAFAPRPLTPRSVAPLPEDNSGDVFEAAAALASDGELLQAVAMLMRDAATQPSGRLRYRRRLEVAQLCVAGGSPAIAAPVLRDLLAEMQERKLESWETGDMVVRPLALMLQCMDGNSGAESRNELFAALCRVDPTAALELMS